MMVVVGIHLGSGKEKAVGPHVHAQGETWAITSKHPVDESLLTVDVLERLLPGCLGAYVYPHDAVMHIPGKKRTTAADAARTLSESQKGPEAHEIRRINHLTLKEYEDSFVEDVAEYDEEDDYEEDEDEEGGEEGEIWEDESGDDDDNQNPPPHE